MQEIPVFGGAFSVVSIFRSLVCFLPSHRPTSGTATTDKPFPSVKASEVAGESASPGAFQGGDVHLDPFGIWSSIMNR